MLQLFFCSENWDIAYLKRGYVHKASFQWKTFWAKPFQFMFLMLHLIPETEQNGIKFQMFQNEGKNLHSNIYT